MTKKPAPSRRLVGAKTIMRYLKEKHDIEMCRATFWRIMTREGPSRFPAERMQYALGGVRVVSETGNVDAWVRIHAFREVTQK